MATVVWEVQGEVEDLRWVKEVDMVAQGVLRHAISAIASTTSSGTAQKSMSMCRLTGV